ncbi:MAG: glycosyltransferase family 4 protein [bacterium]|nr:glycosyltransferase family 4 protein [bacterium]
MRPGIACSPPRVSCRHPAAGGGSGCASCSIRARFSEEETLHKNPPSDPVSPSPLRIAFLTPEYPPLRSGGIGTQLRNLARNLVAQGHRVTVVGWGEETRFEDEGVRVRFGGHTRVPRMGWLLNRRRALRELIRLDRKEGLDVVEAPDWCGLSAGMRPPCPVVIRCHGSATYFGHLLDERTRPTVRWAEQLALRQADAVVAVSRFTAELTRRLFRLRDPVGVIPNGIDLARFRPAETAASEPDTVLYFGTLVRKKGVLDLCQAFSRVVDAYPRARLQLVGRDAPDRRTGSRSTWRLCEDLLSPAARERTAYLGPRPHDQIREIVQAAGLSVFPSYGEALPLTWLEAMACAKPIVAYDIGWANEVVESEVTGLLVAPGNVDALSRGIAALLEDKFRCQRLGAAGRERADRLFSVEIVTQRTVSWYRAVIDRAEATRSQLSEPIP